MNTNTFPVGAHTYSVGKLGAIPQFHVVRRLAPALMGLAPMLQNRTEAMAALKVDPLRVLSPLVDAFGSMDDKDVNYVLSTCLSVVQRKQPDPIGWAAVTSTQGDIMFDDIGMVELAHLVWKVLEYNVAGFYSALQGLFPSAPEGRA